jgi:hypothetical protein
MAAGGVLVLLLSILTDRNLSSPESVFGCGFLFIFSVFPYELNPQRSQFLGWAWRIWKWLRGWVGLGSKV